jgi:hypothetical protein
MIYSSAWIPRLRPRYERTALRAKRRLIGYNAGALEVLRSARWTAAMTADRATTAANDAQFNPPWRRRECRVTPA